MKKSLHFDLILRMEVLMLPDGFFTECDMAILCSWSYPYLMLWELIICQLHHLSCSSLLWIAQHFNVFFIVLFHNCKNNAYVACLQKHRIDPDTNSCRDWRRLVFFCAWALCATNKQRWYSLGWSLQGSHEVKQQRVWEQELARTPLMCFFFFFFLPV